MPKCAEIIAEIFGQDGYYQFDGVTKTDKTLNGSTVYKTNTAWSSLRLNLGKQLIDRRIVKVGEEFVLFLLK